MTPSSCASAGAGSAARASVATTVLTCESMGSLRIGKRGWKGSGQLQPRREQRGRGESGADARDARAPAEAVEQPAERGGAGEAAEKVARQVEAARRAAVAGRGAADEAGGDGLGEEGAHPDEGEPGNHEN